MTRYVCLECNYRFVSNISQKGKKCPYCGRDKIVPEQDAQELLQGD